jgi:hypothetical protein
MLGMASSQQGYTVHMRYNGAYIQVETVAFPDWLLTQPLKPFDSSVQHAADTRKSRAYQLRYRRSR